MIARHGVRLDTAMSVFRPILKGSKRASFDAAAATYRQWRGAVQPGFLLFMESEATGRAVDDVRPQLTAALRELLAVSQHV